jgi:hypothetical protein
VVEVELVQTLDQEDLVLVELVEMDLVVMDQRIKQSKWCMEFKKSKS